MEPEPWVKLYMALLTAWTEGTAPRGFDFRKTLDELVEAVLAYRQEEILP